MPTFSARVLNHQPSWSHPLECSQNREHLKTTLTPCIYSILFPHLFCDSYIIPTQIPYLKKKCSSFTRKILQNRFQTDFTLLLLILSRNISPSQSAQTPGQKSSLPALVHCQEKFCFVSFLICINWWKLVYRLCDRLWGYECSHEQNKTKKEADVENPILGPDLFGHLVEDFPTKLPFWISPWSCYKLGDGCWLNHGICVMYSNKNG